jgi:transcriptional regulator with XRE-family HTH domain
MPDADSTSNTRSAGTRPFVTHWFTAGGDTLTNSANRACPPTASHALLIADSSMAAVKHCFTNKVKHCLITPISGAGDNQAMLNKPELKSLWRADKLKKAMADAQPPIKQSDLARTCGVTKQVVNGWLKTGRIDKKSLPAIAELIGQPLEFLLDEHYKEPTAMFSRSGQRAVAEPPAPYMDKQLQTVTRDWDLLSDLDRARISKEVAQKADHVRSKIREHDRQQSTEAPRTPLEASNESVIHRVVGFIRRPKKPRP